MAHIKEQMKANCDGESFIMFNLIERMKLTAHKRHLANEQNFVSGKWFPKLIHNYIKTPAR